MLFLDSVLIGEVDLELDKKIDQSLIRADPINEIAV